MLLIDLTHTSHTHAQTGIQRVSRSIFQSVSKVETLNAVCFDPYLFAWRKLNIPEQLMLSMSNRTAGKRGAKWPLATRIAGSVRRHLGMIKNLPGGTGLIVPEVFSPKTATAFQTLFPRIRGPKIALFHDAIALQFPELSPPKTVSRFPSYLEELSRFDGIAAISTDSKSRLCGYWDWLGLKTVPPVTTISLGIDVPATVSVPSSEHSRQATILSVGTIEGRKNHVSLLNACETLWERGFSFTLHLIGMANNETGKSALQLIESLKAKGRPLRYDGPATDAELATAYHDCAFSVYPSLIEGFGLPVQESLIRGIPCICSAQGALGESAQGGGCLALQKVDAEDLRAAIEILLQHPTELQRLKAEIPRRQFKSWKTYATELVSWMQTLKPRET